MTDKTRAIASTYTYGMKDLMFLVFIDTTLHILRGSEEKRLVSLNKSNY